MTVGLPFLGKHIYSNVKKNYKFLHLECARPRALRPRYVSILQNGYDAYNCRYETRQANTFDVSGLCVCRHSVGQI